MAMAMTGGFLPDSKAFAVAVNFGNFAGQSAMAMSSYYRVSSNTVLSGGISYGVNSNQVGTRVGALFAW
jgi:hypothetical protein